MLTVFGLLCADVHLTTKSGHCAVLQEPSRRPSQSLQFLLARPPQPSLPLTYHAVVSLSVTVVHHIINVIGGSKLGCGNRIHEAPRVANSSLPRCCIRYCDTLSPTPNLTPCALPTPFPSPPIPLISLTFYHQSSSPSSPPLFGSFGTIPASLRRLPDVEKWSQ